MTLNEVKLAVDGFLDDKITPLSNQHRMAIFIAALVIPIAVFYFLYYAPKGKEIKGLEGQKVYLVGEIKKVEATVAQLEKHKAEKKETEEKFKLASMLLPGGKEIPSLLTNLSSLGTNSGLEVITFSPGAEAPQQFYATIPLRLTIKGTYHNIGIFLDKVSKLPRIVSATDITLSGGQPQDGAMFLNSNINLVTYRFTEAR
jgi:type IV pilus assembly protein PilO